MAAATSATARRTSSQGAPSGRGEGRDGAVGTRMSGILAGHRRGAVSEVTGVGWQPAIEVSRHHQGWLAAWNRGLQRAPGSAGNQKVAAPEITGDSGARGFAVSAGLGQRDDVTAATPVASRPAAWL